MWEAACRRVFGCVHAVLHRYHDEQGRERYESAGTAFSIGVLSDGGPVFLTNQHVLIGPNNHLMANEDLAIAVHGPSDAAISGVFVHVLDGNLDVAVLEGSLSSINVAKSVTFASDESLERGTPVASFGFPIPDPSIRTPTGGQLSSHLRLATGYISNLLDNVSFSPQAPPDPLVHYETNMLAYPGISGGPLFDLKGNVVGINRGTRLFNNQVAAYAYARRNQELLEFLDRWNIRYNRAGSAQPAPRRRR